MGREDRLITPHDQYRQIARTRDARLEAYRALFKAHIDPETVDEIRKATNGNYALGDRRFQAQIEKALGRRARRGVAGRPRAEADKKAAQIELL